MEVNNRAGLSTGYNCGIINHNVDGVKVHRLVLALPVETYSLEEKDVYKGQEQGHCRCEPKVYSQGNHKEAGNMGLLVHWLPSLYIQGFT